MIQYHEHQLKQDRLSESEWQRVIDENFYVKTSSYSFLKINLRFDAEEDANETNFEDLIKTEFDKMDCLGTLAAFVPTIEKPFIDQNSQGNLLCHIVRQPGLRQPWFGRKFAGFEFPKICFATLRDGFKVLITVDKPYTEANWEWEHGSTYPKDVVEFIEL